MVEILWQARAPGGAARLCLEASRPYVERSVAYKPDRFTERIIMYEARTKAQLEQLVWSQLPIVRDLRQVAVLLGKVFALLPVH